MTRRRFRHVLSVLGLGLSVGMSLALAACTSSPAPERPRLFAEFEAAGQLVARASGPGEFLGIDLVAPDGRRFAGENLSPAEIERRETARGVGPGRYPAGIGIGASGGSSSGVHPQIGISIPVRNPFASPRIATSFGMARIALPEAALRAPDWADWHLVVRFANDGRNPVEWRQAPPPLP